MIITIIIIARFRNFYKGFCLFFVIFSRVFCAFAVLSPLKSAQKSTNARQARVTVMPYSIKISKSRALSAALIVATCNA